MKPKMYRFSGTSELEKVAGLSAYRDQYELVPTENLTAGETLVRQFDMIELQNDDYEQFKPLISAVGWKINHLNVADVLIREKNYYRPVNVLADCILQVVRERMSSISTSAEVMIIGDYNFVLSVTSKLALAGFSHFIISLDDDARFFDLEKRLSDFIFNLKIRYVRLNELTQVPSSSALLVSNVNEKMNPEAYESLAYFNYLASGAVFVDANSEKNPSLAQEARRAELTVIEEIEILTLKYKTLLELCKNSSFV